MHVRREPVAFIALQRGAGVIRGGGLRLAGAAGEDEGNEGDDDKVKWLEFLHPAELSNGHATRFYPARTQLERVMAFRKRDAAVPLLAQKPIEDDAINLASSRGGRLSCPARSGHIRVPNESAFFRLLPPFEPAKKPNVIDPSCPDPGLRPCCARLSRTAPAGSVDSVVSHSLTLRAVRLCRAASASSIPHFSDDCLGNARIRRNNSAYSSLGLMLVEP